MDREKLAPYAGREQASVKHFLLESYLKRLVMITGMARYSRIAYVDAFAGPWKSARDDLSDTSFARAIEVMEECRLELSRKFQRTVSFRALFVERDPERYSALNRFAALKSNSSVEITALNEDFSASAESVSHWIRDDEMAFVLVDPTGWKDVIYPATLGPLLRKPNVEMLINVMWNFINLALGHANQESNLRALFGPDFQSLLQHEGTNKGRNCMRAYLKQLRAVSGVSVKSTRLRTAWFPVEFPSKDRVLYYLTYVTHHVKGMIVFLEESDRALSFQRKVKFVVKQQRRETESGIRDFFGDDIRVDATAPDDENTEVRSRWLGLIPAQGAEARVDESVIADMAEECGCQLGRLQESLRGLIENGIVVNLDAKRTRKKNAINYKAGETIRRLRLED